ncbi:hypothetical protein F2Y39_08300, partial [Bacteroides caccae]
KEILKISQLKENEPIFIVNEKKEGASCITTHLLKKYKAIIYLTFSSIHLRALTNASIHGVT